MLPLPISTFFAHKFVFNTCVIVKEKIHKIVSLRSEEKQNIDDSINI